MADNEISTRAPESDLHEEPLNAEPSQSSAQAQSQTTQPQLSDHCTTDRPLPASLSEAPTGSISSWPLNKGQDSKDTQVYISKPSDYPTTPASLLLLLTNGTGIHSQNNQHQADLFARNGYLVVMPDLFAGDPAPNSKPQEHALESTASWLDTVKLKAAETAKSFMLDMWLARHTPDTVLPTLHAVVEHVESEFEDTISHGGGIYAVGYCFGGKYALMLAGESNASEASDAEQGTIRKGPHIKAGICAHGTLVAREDLKNVKVPIHLICVEEDPLFPTEVLEAGKKSLTENSVAHDVHVYPGVPHGQYSSPQVIS